jgi:aerobic carbon-monoxide dehydrogenase large subunit
VVGGIAIVKAAEKVIEKAKPIAAHMLEASEGDLEFAGGRFTVKGTDKGVGIQDIALAVFAAHDYPEGIEPDIDAHATFDPENFSFPHGTHLCAVEVDTETGMVSMYKYVCVDDVGNIINPLIVEGQVHGGLAQGIAQALFEEAAYDDQGTLLSGTLVDYTLPSAADLISFDTANTTTASTTNPLGAKGVGEAGTITSTPAVVNSVLDAIRHLGVKDIDMPTTPYRVWSAIQKSSGTAGRGDEANIASPGAGLGSTASDISKGDTQGGHL